MKIGVISDTHGLLRPEALQALKGVEHILHAGDIGGAEVLDQLANLAPVTAVIGNVDVGHPWATDLPERKWLTLVGWKILLLHDANQASPSDRVMADLMISGHSHQPGWQPGEYGKTVGWLNPGSAGRRRFRLPVCLARVELVPESSGIKPAIEVKIIDLVSS